MIVRIFVNTNNVSITPEVVRVVRVYNYRVPSGIPETSFTQKGGWLLGTGPSTYAELPPGTAGQYPTPDPTTPTGWKFETPSIAISDASNFLINGGFDLAQRQTPGTLTTIADNGYSADRWRITRENADLQYQRNDATSESGLTSRYYGKFKKITNAGKFLVAQIIEGAMSVPLRGKTVIFQVKMKASTAKTIRMAIIELGSGGTIDTIPASIVSAWNVDSTDPTLGSNLATITPGAASKSVTTAWQNFSVSVSIPATSKNIVCAVWSDADFSANDELNLAEAGLFIGTSLLAWTPRPLVQEELLCYRRFQKSYGKDILPGTASASGSIFCYCTAINVARVLTNFLVEMAAVPTIVLYPFDGTPTAKISTLAGADIGTTVTPSSNTEKGINNVVDSGSGLTAGTVYIFHFTASAEL